MSLRTMQVGSTGMAVASEHLAIISNNLANVTTNAFKRSVASFADVFYDVVHPPAGAADRAPGLGISFGTGVLLRGTLTDLGRGPTVPGFDLDVAIDGDGFFRVMDREGSVFYTRLGTFQPKGVGAAGPLSLQLSEGSFTLDPPIVLPGEDAATSVERNGIVRQGSTVAGQLELVRFPNPEGLLQVGDLLFARTLASGDEIVGRPADPGFGPTLDGFLEGSNVDVSVELIDLLAASREFNFNARSFSAGSDEVERVISLARGL